jgi:splicing factor 3B subunit 2
VNSKIIRYGPPPSYPNLKVPGLNAPIPPGASYGYHPGGWGKPPVDEFNRPLYGDVFGATSGVPSPPPAPVAPIERNHWGELEDEPEQEEEEEEEEEQEQGIRFPLYFYIFILCLFFFFLILFYYSFIYYNN